MTKGEKALLFFRDNIGFIIIVIVLGIYVAKGLVQIDETGKTIQQIIGDGILATVLGFSIAVLFEKQGLISGEKSDKMIATRTLHGALVESVAPDMDVLDDWCEGKTKEALRNKRIFTLTRKGIKYYSYFDENGDLKENAFEGLPKTGFWAWMKWNKLHERWKRNKTIRRTVKKALHDRVTPLTTNSLTGTAGKDYDPFYFGKSTNSYSRKSSFTGLFSKLLTGALFGYFGVKVLDNPDYEELIWTGIQAATFLVGGGLKYIAAFLFIVQDTRDGVIKKMDNLQKFKNTDKAKYRKEALKNG